MPYGRQRSSCHRGGEALRPSCTPRRSGGRPLHDTTRGSRVREERRAATERALRPSCTPRRSGGRPLHDTTRGSRVREERRAATERALRPSCTPRRSGGRPLHDTTRGSRVREERTDGGVLGVGAVQAVHHEHRHLTAADQRRCQGHSAPLNTPLRRTGLEPRRVHHLCPPVRLRLLGFAL
jgi:hypothetical protein